MKKQDDAPFIFVSITDLLHQRLVEQMQLDEEDAASLKCFLESHLWADDTDDDSEIRTENEPNDKASSKARRKPKKGSARMK